MPQLAYIQTALNHSGEVQLFASQSGTGQGRHGLWTARFSGTNALTSWQRINTGQGFVVAAHVNEQGAIELFSTGSPGHLIQNGIGSSQWTQGPVTIGSDTVLLPWPNDRLELFCTDGGAVQQRWEAGTSGVFVNYWQPLNGQPPSVGGVEGTAFIDGSPTVVARSAERSLWVCSSGWHTWYPIGGNTRAGVRPGQCVQVGNRTNGTFVAAHLDPHGHVWFWDHSTHAWKFLNGGGFTDLVMLENNGTMRLFALDAESNLVSRRENSPLGSWSWPWENLGRPNSMQMDMLRVLREGSGRLRVVVRCFGGGATDIGTLSEDAQGNASGWSLQGLA